MTKSNELAVLKTSDFQEAGIATSLNQNDLVEIFADEGYSRIMKSVKELIQKGDILNDQWEHVYDQEVDVMRKEVGINKQKDFEVSYELPSRKGWEHISHTKLRIDDGSKWGILIKSNNDYQNIYFPKNDSSTHTIDLVLSYDGNTEVHKDIKSGKSVIEYKHLTREDICYRKNITLPYKKLMGYVELVKQYNLEVNTFLKKLPDGYLSVERFAREARLKMNKQLLRSSTTPAFQQKLMQHFNIKL